jgi:hypothetical protein
VGAVEKWSPPKTLKQVQSFLGFTNYLKMFAKNYSKMIGPINDVLKGATKRINLTPEAQEGFLTIKKK